MTLLKKLLWFLLFMPAFFTNLVLCTNSSTYSNSDEVTSDADGQAQGNVNFMLTFPIPSPPLMDMSPRGSNKSKRQFDPWGGKRQSPSSHSTTQLDRSKRQFTPWAGKKRAGSAEEDQELLNGMMNSLMLAKKDRFGFFKRGFNSWAGKRSGDILRNKKKFNSWGGKRGINFWAGKKPLSAMADTKFGHLAEKRAFNSYLAKKNSENGKKTFNSWGGKRGDDQDEEYFNLWKIKAKENEFDEGSNFWEGKGEKQDENVLDFWESKRQNNQAGRNLNAWVGKKLNVEGENQKEETGSNSRASKRTSLTKPYEVDEKSLDSFLSSKQVVPLAKKGLSNLDFVLKDIPAYDDTIYQT